MDATLSRFTLSLSAALCALALSACQTTTTTTTSSGASSSAPRQEIVTTSDETEIRKRARLRVELASGYFERGQATTALDEIKQALALFPEYVDALTLRGLIYSELGQPELAEDAYKRATSIDARNGDAQHNYGWFLCKQRRFQEAAARFQSAIAVPAYPGIVNTHLAFGVCQMRAGRMVDAETQLYRAFELDPTNPATATNLAMVHLTKGDGERARFYARKVNNSELASAESLWLGIRVEKFMNDERNVAQLGEQLRRRFPSARQTRLLDAGAFNEQ
jgi:type IV pilus assembly protein PilF